MEITRWEGVEMQISTLNNPDIILPESVSLVLPQQTHSPRGHLHIARPDISRYRRPDYA